MNQIDTILKNEKSNLDRIFIYILDDSFVAFGRSAFYVALFCPQLDVFLGQSDIAGSYLYIHIPSKWVCWLTEKCSTLVDDKYIRVIPPLNLSRQWYYFEEWQQQQLNKFRSSTENQ